MASWDFIQKQVIIGSSSCGKSSLLVRLTDDRFLAASEPTIGVEFGSRLVKLETGVHAGKLVKLQIWDTAGQEAFKSITRSYYRGAGGALLVFDLTHRPSFIACQDWLRDLRAYAEEDLVILLVGNKLDLCTSDPTARQVSTAEALAFVSSENLGGYTETSAKLGDGVIKTFNDLTHQVFALQQESLALNRQQQGGQSFPTISLGGIKSVAGGKCC